MHPYIQSPLVALLISLSMLLSGCISHIGNKTKTTSQSIAPPQATTRRIPHNHARWESEIAAMEAADRTNPPPKGGVLFIGSSTIRMWSSLQKDFPNHKVINRGFGGSQIANATHFAERLVFPHEPRQIFLRSGGNDLHAGRLPDEVANDFADFVNKVHARLPNTEILFIGLAPAPARWGQMDKNSELNRLVREMALNMPRVAYIDTWTMSLTNEGYPRYDIFLDDQLHFNALGYNLLATRIRPYLHTVRAPSTTRP